MSKETTKDSGASGDGADEACARRLSEHLSRAAIELSFAREEAKLAGDDEKSCAILLALAAVRSAMNAE